MFGEEPPGARSDTAPCVTSSISGAALGFALLSLMTCSFLSSEPIGSMLAGVASCFSRAARLAPDGCQVQRVFQRPTCLSSLSLLKIPSPTMVCSRRVATWRVGIIAASQGAIALRMITGLRVIRAALAPFVQAGFDALACHPLCTIFSQVLPPSSSFIASSSFIGSPGRQG